ncbi:MAG: hypothetical protein NC483_00615 [Ruminococcus sp.]|nr:hypothetical protein [Ruminococcus sp.]
MKTAEELFKELGFALIKDNFCRIKYENKVTGKTVSFIKAGEVVSIGPNCCGMSMQLLQAINKQVEELGWK